MRVTLRCIAALVAASLLFASSGCLSLGGKTVYTSESPKTDERLASLETRVSVLEKALTGNAGPPPPPPAVDHPR